MSTPPRQSLHLMTSAQLAPLEERITDEWHEAWADFARSAYVSLLSAGLPPSVNLANLAVKIAEGLVHDLGGTQPYIPSGKGPRARKRLERVITLIEQGTAYRDVATGVGISESIVRRYEKLYRSVRASLALGQSHAEVADRLALSENRVGEIAAVVAHIDQNPPRQQMPLAQQIARHAYPRPTKPLEL